MPSRVVSSTAERPIDVSHLYASEVDADVVSYDSYDAGRSHYTALERFRAAGLASRRPCWRYIRGFNYDDDAGAAPTEADMRWDAFSGALYGYTGHTWFLYTISTNPDIGPVFFATENDFTAATTETWHRAAQINTELSHLGRALTQLVSTDVRYQAALSFRAPEGTRPWSRVLTLDKVNGRIAPLPFTGTSAAGAVLEVALSAGEIVFWKYDTGAAFVWR